MKNASSVPPSQPRKFFVPVMLLVVLSVLFWKSFVPGYVHFSNDGPLARQMVTAIKLPASLKGIWDDSNILGNNGGSAAPDITVLISWMLGPVGFAKFLAPMAMFILGFCAWIFFRRLKLSPLAAALGGLAAGLQSAWFSNACWGVASQQIAIAMTYLALALVVSNTPETPLLVRWTRIALAGLAVGVNVMEGADNGAIFSLFIAAFVLVKSLLEESQPIWLKAGSGVMRVIVIAAFAGFIAAQSIVALVGVAITGVTGTEQTPEAKAGQWDFATQWSLPKTETLGLFVPGLFGYRMDTPKDATWVDGSYQGGNYWGGIGRDPGIDRFFDKIFQSGDELTINLNTTGYPDQSVAASIDSSGNINPPLLGQIKAAGRSGLQLKETIDQAYAAQGIQGSVQTPQGFMRFSGGGNYGGIVIGLIAFWAIAQSFRRRDSVFSEPQRRLIWFWTAVSILAILMAWGRFAPDFLPLYKLFYTYVPYSSAMRNPTKFISIFWWAFVVLFAYGVHGLSRRYLEVSANHLKSGIAQFQSWWKNVRGFDRKWTVACGIIFIASAIAWGIYVSEKPALITYLQTVQASGDVNQIAAFSIAQAGWFLVIFAAAILLCTLIISGIFSGKRARIGGILLGILLLVDVVHSDLPWIVHWNYPVKYQSNSIVDLLRNKPYEHRVTDLPFSAAPTLPKIDAYLWEELYRIEWIQQLFPFYNIQSLDIVMQPRMATDLQAYYRMLAPNGTLDSLYLLTRNWQLSNNRYLLGPTAIRLPQGDGDTLSFLNDYLDPAQKRFRIVQRFDVAPKDGYDIAGSIDLEKLTVTPNDNGGCALFEFTGALPRAKLYANWETNTLAEMKNFTTNGLSEMEKNVLGNVGTNEFLTLKKLASPQFDPEKTVLLDAPLPINPTVATNAGTVDYVSHESRNIQLKASVLAPAVLLFNDKYDPHWNVSVDGKSAELFRANFIMRGVYLAPGEHSVRFYFTMPNKPFYVTLSAIGVAILLSAILILLTRKPKIIENKK